MHEANLVIDALMASVKKWLLSRQSPVARFYTCTFVAADSNDPNLSTLTLPGGGTATQVRRIASSVTFTAGDQLLCMQAPGVPLTILGKPIGVITIADDGLGPYAPPDETPTENLSGEEV